MSERVFEMFAGYGGGSFALKKANIDYTCVGFSEIYNYAIQCFEQNHKGNNYGDCRHIDPSNLPDFDLLLGGFPCQPFSEAGKHGGELDTRGTLFHDIIRIAKVKQPKRMLLENVKGLTFANHRDTFSTILSALDKIGYTVYWKVLNSRDYGIPQSRERVFFVCIRKDIDFEFQFPPKEPLGLFLKDIVEGGSDEVLVSIARRNKNRSKHQHLGLPYGTFPKEYHLVHNKDLGVSYAVKSARHEFMVGTIDHENVRNLTPKECFRLMGFLDDEINLENIPKTHQYALAGNGWDINLVSNLLGRMIDDD